MQEGTVDAIFLLTVCQQAKAVVIATSNEKGVVTSRTKVGIFALTIVLTALISGRLLGGGGVYRFAVDEIRRFHVFHRQAERFE